MGSMARSRTIWDYQQHLCLPLSHRATILELLATVNSDYTVYNEFQRSGLWCCRHFEPALVHSQRKE